MKNTGIPYIMISWKNNIKRGDSYRLKSRIKGGVKVVPPADIPELDNMARGV